MKIADRLPPAWAELLQGRLDPAALDRLSAFLASERAAGKAIAPAEDDWFRALELTPPDAVRVVILGQDPYHGPGQAHGLSFSVRPGMKVPPSLANIFKEITADLGTPRPAHGLLDHWARQGVLLLNAVLTVELGRAGAHQGRGWEGLTDAIVAHVARRDCPSVFMLWGSHARKKAGFVDPARHLVLTAPHPSPLSAHRGFLGCRHFSAANAFLTAQGREPVDWSLPIPSMSASDRDHPPSRSC